MVKVIWVVGSFCDVCSLAIWLIHFIWGTNKTHGGPMHHTPLPGQKVKVTCLFCAYLSDSLDIRCKHNSWGVIHCFQVKRSSHAGRLKFLQCPLHGSMPIWPIRVIRGTNSANEGTMCHVPLTFPGQKVKVIQVIHICTAEVWAWISNSIPMTNDELSMSHPDLYTLSVMYMVLNQSWRSCTGTVQTLTVW